MCIFKVMQTQKNKYEIICLILGGNHFTAHEEIKQTEVFQIKIC